MSFNSIISNTFKLILIKSIKQKLKNEYIEIKQIKISSKKHIWLTLL